MSKILLTGGAGFVGSHTAELLLRHGHTVRCLLRPHRSSLGWLEGLSIEVRHADLTDEHQILSCMEGIDAVVHVAGVTKAKNRQEYYNGNTETTRTLANAARKAATVQKFVLLSSTTAVGPSPDGKPITSQTIPHPITEYGRSKLAAEPFVQALSDRMATVILRPPAVYGPRDTDIFEFFRWVKLGIRPVIADVKKELSLIHARDLAASIMAVLSTDKADGKTYLVSDPNPVLVSEVLHTLASIAGKRTIPLFLPRSLVYSLGAIMQTAASVAGKAAVLNIEKARDLVQPYWTCDPSEIEKDLGFRTSIRLEDGLRETWDWYRHARWL